MPFSSVVYIEEGDFREADSKDYFGLAPGKAVMLRCVRGACVRAIERVCGRGPLA
jgi:hypothetical protein